MNRPEYYIGMDVAAETLAVGMLRSPEQPIQTLPEIANTLDGFQALEQWMAEHHATQDNVVLCLEATGVYGEALSYYLCSKNYRLAVKPPLKVKRAFHQGAHKTDPVDAGQIAEYAYRFFDELHFWTPPSPILEQIKTLLSARDHFIGQRLPILMLCVLWNVSPSRYLSP
jgi:transposase